MYVYTAERNTKEFMYIYYGEMGQFLTFILMKVQYNFIKDAISFQIQFKVFNH